MGNDSVTVAFLMVNSERASSDDVLTDGVSDLANSGCSAITNSAVAEACVARVLTRSVAPFFTNDCDGIVAADVFEITGAELDKLLTAARFTGPWWTWAHTYHERHSNTSAGCHATSVYTVAIRFMPL
jgi:hypothetical protein